MSMMTLNFHSTAKIEAVANVADDHRWIEVTMTDYNGDENRFAVFFQYAGDAVVYADAINSAAAANLARREAAAAAAFEDAKHSDPCTEEAREHGCTCGMESVNSASIDPPEPVIDRECPLHGDGFDPDAARDARIDHEMMGIV